MKCFRALATLSAGAWLGGMVLIAIAAQTTFQVMRTLEVATPDAFAGRIMAVEFVRFDKMQFVCAAVLVAYQIAQTIIGPRSKRDLFRFALIVLACGLLFYSAFYVTPKILGMQNHVAGTTDEALRAAFDSIHETSVCVAKITMMVVMLIAFELALPCGKPAIEHA